MVSVVLSWNLDFNFIGKEQISEVLPMTKACLALGGCFLDCD